MSKLVAVTLVDEIPTFESIKAITDVSKKITGSTRVECVVIDGKDFAKIGKY